LALVAGGGGRAACRRQTAGRDRSQEQRTILLVNDADMEDRSGQDGLNASPVKLMPLLQQALDGNKAYAEQYQVSYEAGDLPDALINVDANRMGMANLLSNAAGIHPPEAKFGLWWSVSITPFVSQ
jgi:signal transduction histidine kinase